MIPMIINEMNGYDGNVEDRISLDLKFEKLMV